MAPALSPLTSQHTHLPCFHHRLTSFLLRLLCAGGRHCAGERHHLGIRAATRLPVILVGSPRHAPVVKAKTADTEDEAACAVAEDEADCATVAAVSEDEVETADAEDEAACAAAVAEDEAACAAAAIDSVARGHDSLAPDLNSSTVAHDSAAGDLDEATQELNPLPMADAGEATLRLHQAPSVMLVSSPAIPPAAGGITASRTHHRNCSITRSGRVDSEVGGARPFGQRKKKG